MSAPHRSGATLSVVHEHPEAGTNNATTPTTSSLAVPQPVVAASKRPVRAGASAARYQQLSMRASERRRQSQVSIHSVVNAKSMARRKLCQSRRLKAERLMASAPDTSPLEPVMFDYGAFLARKAHALCCCGSSRVITETGATSGDKYAVATTDAAEKPAKRLGPVVYTFNPENRWKSLWDWVIVVMVVYNTIVVPFELAFNPVFATTTEFAVFDSFVDFCFVIDIMVTLNTAVAAAWNKFTHNHKDIFFKYLRGLLIVDIIAVIPFNTLVVWTGGDTKLGFFRMMKLVRLLRLGRLMKKMEQLSSANALRVLKLLAGFVLLSHILGCVWYSVSESLLLCYHDPTCDSDYSPDDIWVSQAVAWDPSTVTTRHKYTVSLFYMLTTMTTVGYGACGVWFCLIVCCGAAEDALPPSSPPPPPFPTVSQHVLRWFGEQVTHHRQMTQNEPLPVPYC